MNNIKPPQVASPPPVTISSAKVKPPQVIKQPTDVKAPPLPQTQSKSENPPPESGKGLGWTVVVLVVLAIVAVVVFFIAKDKNEPTQGPSAITEPWHPITPESISLDKDALKFENIGASEKLTATVFPANVSEKNKEVIWQSSNETVATVDANGIITAIANGNAVITAYTLNGFSAACSVHVKIPVPFTGPTPAQLNDLLRKIANSDDQATDRIRKVLGNTVRVEGAPNISNVQQLITDVSNGNHYVVTKVNTNADGKIVSISVSK